MKGGIDGACIAAASSFVITELAQSADYQ